MRRCCSSLALPKTKNPALTSVVREPVATAAAYVRAFIRLPPRHPAATPLAVILERHCTSARSVATGNRFGNLLLTRANPKRSPKRLFRSHASRGRNISFGDDDYKERNDGLRERYFPNATSIAVTISSKSSFVHISAGLRHRVLLCCGKLRLVRPIITPCFRQSLTTEMATDSSTGWRVFLSATNSTPTNNPLPRTSPITACLSCNSRRLSIK